MLKLVVAINMVIALGGFYLAWRLWRVKQGLARFAAVLTIWERNTHRALNPDITPALIRRGQTGTASLRDQYALLEKQLQQLQRVVTFALMGRRLLQQGGWGRRRWRRR